MLKHNMCRSVLMLLSCHKRPLHGTISSMDEFMLLSDLPGSHPTSVCRARFERFVKTIADTSVEEVYVVTGDSIASCIPSHSCCDLSHIIDSYLHE